MLSHMHRTTITMPDTLFDRVKRLALSEHMTLKEAVAALLKRGLDVMGTPQRHKALPKLPIHRGKALLDISDRDALYRVLDEDRW